MPLPQRDQLHDGAPTLEAVGPAVAFAELYDEYFDAIYWYCRNRLNDAATAEDAASTIFTRAFAAGPRYHDPGLRSWLFTIAHNVVINVYRANRPQAPLEAAASLPDPVMQLEDAVVADEEYRRLLDALRQLPADQRQVVELRMAGLTGPEIARIMHRSHGAIKMLQLRAFARLREILAELPGEESSHA
ncbi:MAG: sigma-70 family RNA polymerase sigma factor [Thermomicrobiales bacterium]|nr:sigma-70 family RNA polymerase sigma factor [Thermomicrobiales bacterium]